VEVEDWRKPGLLVSRLQACIYGVKSPNPRLGSRSKYVVIIVLWFTGLLYSLRVGNRVTIRSVSVVLGLGILVFIPYLARLVSSSVGRDNPIVTFRVSSCQKVW
jgi:hypothetical protein